MVFKGFVCDNLDFSIVVFFIKRIGVVFLLLMCLLWYGGFKIPYNIIYDSYGSILFFSVGAFFSIHKTDWVSLCAKDNIGGLFLFVYLLCLIITSITRNEIFAKTISLLSIPSALYLTTVVYSVYSKKAGGKLLFCINLGNFVTMTFFIFLYHFYLPIPLTVKAVKYISDIFSVETSLYFQLCLAVAEKTIYLMLIFYFSNKLFPRITSIVVGGRMSK